MGRTERRHAGIDAETRDAIVAEHDRLSGILEQLERGADPDRVPGLLAGLHELLRHHFAREEAPNGLYEVLAARAAEHQDRVATLRSDHQIILAEAEDLERRLASSPNPADLRTKLMLHCQRLRAHERAEAKLLIDSLSLAPSKS